MELIKVRYLEDFGDSKKGQINNMSKKDAREIVKEGICEYMEEPKEKELTKTEKKEIAKKLRIEAKRREQANVQFNYESYKPQQEITEIEQLEKIIKKNFPTIWFETKACLSVFASMSLKNLNGCPSLNLVGNPSGEKTTCLDFFYGEPHSYISDDFTPKAFVTQASGIAEELLESVDLLPKINNRVLLTPELSPIFETTRDKLIENFSILTRVLDGEGLNRDSGTHGHRGYSGDYKFAWIGATTPLKSSVWNVMGKMGNRLFFLNMSEKNRTNEDYLQMFQGKAYDEKVKECRGAVHSFLKNFYEQKPIRSLEWESEQDILLLPEIIRYAKFLANLRGTLMTWKSSEEGKYEHSFPIIEEPPRAINSLYNFAKGHALINGRNFLRKEDLELVHRIALSSMPHDRYEFLKLLAKHEGKLSTANISSELKCSNDTSLRTMQILETLGIVTIKTLDIESGMVGRKMQYIEIKPEFKDLLPNTQGRNCEINNKTQENRGVCDVYDSVKMEDLKKL